MADRNARARARAVERGEATYRCEVVDYWPACVKCGRPIRTYLVGSGWPRTCGCPGVMWRHDWETGRWVRVEPAEETTA